MFNFSPKWNFPSNNNGPILGIADSGVETFKGTPIKSLAREICQNSLDARLDDSKPTKIEFKTFDIDPKSIPDYSNFEDAFKRSLDFWSIQESTQAKKFFTRALKGLHSSSIKCLRISDFNTSGLTGSHEEYNSPWCNLTKSSGASDKSGSRGGSFGIGKFAPFACSVFGQFSTVPMMYMALLHHKVWQDSLPLKTRKRKPHKALVFMAMIRRTCQCTSNTP